MAIRQAIRQTRGAERDLFTPTAGLVTRELPAELDPNYQPPIASDDDHACRRPRVGEWVNTHRPVVNGDVFEFRRSVDGPYLAQVLTVTDEGCMVRAWSRPHLGFVDQFFAPWCVIVSRTQVNRYSLTGEWIEQAA